MLSQIYVVLFFIEMKNLLIFAANFKLATTEELILQACWLKALTLFSPIDLKTYKQNLRDVLK